MADLHHATAFGLIGGHWRLGEEATVLAFLQQMMTGLVSACQRLMPLGQQRAQSILWALQPIVAATAQRVATAEDEAPPAFTPLLEARQHAPSDAAHSPLCQLSMDATRVVPIATPPPLRCATDELAGGATVAVGAAGAQGSLELACRAITREGARRTVVDTVAQTPPLRMIRAFAQADGGALIHLHNVSGGVLGGDDLRVRVAVGADARALVTTTGATRVYRHRPGLPDAVQQTTFSVGAGGLLEYLPDPLIPYAGARYRQLMRCDLTGDGGLFAWDVVTPGREASGERFAYDTLALESVVTVDGAPVAWEKVALQPARQALAAPAALGDYRSFATLLMCRGGQPAATWLALEKALAALADELTIMREVVWGASTLAADGVVVRGLARDARHLSAALPAFWRAGKRALYGLEAILPRKVY